MQPCRVIYLKNLRVWKGGKRWESWRNVENTIVFFTNGFSYKKNKKRSRIISMFLFYFIFMLLLRITY